MSWIECLPAPATWSYDTGVNAQSGGGGVCVNKLWVHISDLYEKM